MYSARQMPSCLYFRTRNSNWVTKEGKFMDFTKCRKTLWNCYMIVNPKHHWRPPDCSNNYSDDVYWGLSCPTVGSLRMLASRGSLPLSVTKLLKQSGESSVYVCGKRHPQGQRGDWLWAVKTSRNKFSPRTAGQGVSESSLAGHLHTGSRKTDM